MLNTFFKKIDNLKIFSCFSCQYCILGNEDPIFHQTSRLLWFVDANRIERRKHPRAPYFRIRMLSREIPKPKQNRSYEFRVALVW